MHSVWILQPFCIYFWLTSLRALHSLIRMVVCPLQRFQVPTYIYGVKVFVSNTNKNLESVSNQNSSVKVNVLSNVAEGLTHQGV